MTRGGDAGDGECYAHPQDLLWWAKGGALRGESWKRVAFLRSIIEADVVNGLTPAPTDEWHWQRVSAASEGNSKLIYLSEHQPAIWATGLPKDDREYEVDVIDAWTMTIAPAKRVPVPGLSAPSAARWSAIGLETHRSLRGRVATQTLSGHPDPPRALLEGAERNIRRKFAPPFKSKTPQAFRRCFDQPGRLRTGPPTGWVDPHSARGALPDGCAEVGQRWRRTNLLTAIQS